MVAIGNILVPQKMLNRGHFSPNIHAKSLKTDQQISAYSRCRYGHYLIYIFFLKLYPTDNLRELSVAEP